MNLRHPPFFSTLLKYASIARTHLQSHGFTHSAAQLGRELLFDLHNGVETTLPRNPSSNPSHFNPILYQGADPKIVRDLFTRLPLAAKASTFMDFGCGKGRALILAAQHGFRRVVGVELDHDLVSLCRINLGNLKRSKDEPFPEVYQADATRFELPPGALTAFLYNPFLGPPLQSVVSRLVQHARTSGNPVRVIYVNPQSLNTFLDHGFTITHSLRHRSLQLAVLMEIPGFHGGGL